MSYLLGFVSSDGLDKVDPEKVPTSFSSNRNYANPLSFPPPEPLFAGDRGRIPSGRAAMSGSFLAGKLRLLGEKLHNFVHEIEQPLIFVLYFAIRTIL
jgi:hypothetical protein